jgi:hypothetical protein
MDMVEVRVLVPVERETEFYRWFADWREGASNPPLIGTAPATLVMEEEGVDQFPAAVAWWKSLTAKERGIWGLWLKASPAMVTADEIVATLGLKGARDIPGILSWSGRKGLKVGFIVDWRFRTDPVSGLPIYGIEDEAYARQLRHAQQLAEDPSSTSQALD